MGVQADLTAPQLLRIGPRFQIYVQEKTALVTRKGIQGRKEECEGVFRFLALAGKVVHVTCVIWVIASQNVEFAASYTHKSISPFLSSSQSSPRLLTLQFNYEIFSARGT